MNIPVFLAKAFTNAPIIRITDPNARAGFRPHFELIAELIYGVTIAAKKNVIRLLFPSKNEEW
jgi:hypothetical protein